MKKIILFSFLMMSTSMLFSQSQRTIFLEEFTQASCPPCETTTPALNAMVAANIEKLVQLRYQTSWPGVDPMNADNPGEVQSRVDYYGVTGVPNLLVDGVDTGSPGTVTQAQIDAAYAKDSPILVAVEHTMSEDLATMDITVNITNEGTVAYDMASDKLRVAIMEEEISWPTPPGSTSLVVFEAVMKTFPTTPAGMDLAAIAAGETWTMTWTDVAIPATIYDYNTLGVIAFVQDDVTRGIINGAMSEPIELEGYADLGVASSASAAGGLCDYAYNGSATVTNSSDGDVSGYTVDLLINGEVEQTITVSEALGAGASNDVMFDEITLPAGTSAIAYSVSVGADEIDIAILNNNSPVSVVGKAGGIVDMIEKGFETDVAGFSFVEGTIIDIPAGVPNWFVVSADVLGAANSIGGFGESDNSYRINFFQWNPAGAPSEASFIVADRYTVPDAGANVTFDYAYTSWGGSNDRLEVQISSDCGESFTSLFNEAGSTLATAPEVNANDMPFVPTVDQWRAVDIDLSDYAGETILVRFKVTTAWGDMMYLDNINVQSTVDVNELAEGETLEVYPNPANQSVTLDLVVENTSNVQVRMIDMLGRTVISETMPNVTGNMVHTMDVSAVSAGSYLIYMTVNDKAVVKRLNVTH